jgi:peptidoglycan/xylan/chitin deacetylase (PgdA/CDA1 family)
MGLVVLLGVGALAVQKTSPGVRHAAAGPPAAASVPSGPLPDLAGVVDAVPDLVRWSGPVEHVFFHSLVVRPDLAFTDDALGRGFADYMVTAHEFRAILDQMWRRGWTLVDVHRVAAGQVMVPRGRRPVVLSEDDVNYYEYARERGQAWRLVVGPAGRVLVERRDGGRVTVTADDVVPIVDQFVAAHPEFSAQGAKGVLALTGYEGLFGERLTDGPAAVTRARAVASALRASGWTLASHTYGHIRLGHDSLAVIRRDIERWKSVAAPVLGTTDVLVYPFGERPSRAGRLLLRGEGFTIQCDIDVRPRLDSVDGVTIMSRRHVDGIAFDYPARLAPFFDVAEVRDPVRPSRRSR